MKILPFAKSIFDLHKHPFAIPAITFMVLFFASCTAFVFAGGQTVEPSDSHIVTLYVDGKPRVIPTRAQSVRDLLASQKIELSPADVIEPAVDAPINAENFSVNIYSARPVTVVDESTGQAVVTQVADRQPLAIAKKAGLTVYPEDKVRVASPDEAVRDGVIGEKIVVRRSIPIKLNLYGTTYDIRTQSRTVAELAEERDLEYDRASILPAPETILKANDIVFITKPGQQITTVEEAIPQPIEYVDTVDLEVGKTQVREPGVAGKRVVVYEVAADGSKKPLQTIVVIQPQRQLVARGAKKAAGFDGGFDAALARLRSCEGSYTSNTGNGYYGAYQFNLGSWRTNAPDAYKNVIPSQAPPAVQDLAAATYYRKSGWKPWPACSRKLNLQDIYR